MSSNPVKNTERKVAEETLQERGKEFRTVFDAAKDGMLVADPETQRFVLANATILKQTGYTEAELLSRSISDMHTPADLPYVIEQFEKMNRGETTLAPDIPVQRKDGTIFFADINSSMVTLHGRQYTLGLFRDITDRKAAEEQLKKTQKDFHSLISNSADIIAVMDLTGVLLYLSPSFDTTLGYRDGKTVIRNSFDLIHPDDAQAVRETILAYTEHPGETQAVELRLRHADGSWRIMDVIGKRSSWGGHDRVIIINARDITERKRADDQLRQLLNEKEILLREIHHRVRNTIQLAVSMMKMQIRRETDKRIRNALLGTQNRLNAIASTFDMLYYSKDMSQVNLRNIIRSVVGSIQSSYVTGEHPIQSDIRIDIPELGVDLALPLALITSELVTNAFQNAFPDGRSGMVTVTESQDEQGKITLTVSDNGPGLPEGLRPVKSGTTGLTIVHTLVQQIDGTLNYETSGKGTKFVITVPLHEKSDKSGVGET